MIAVKISDLNSNANVFVKRSGLGLIQYLETNRSKPLGHISSFYRLGLDNGINSYFLYNSTAVRRRGNNLKSYTIRHPDLHKIYQD